MLWTVLPIALIAAIAVELGSHAGFWVFIGLPSLLCGLYYLATRFERRVRAADAAKAAREQGLIKRSDEQWAARLAGDDDTYTYGAYPPAAM